MSTNISKQKRDELILKVNKIREYLLSAKQDKNTENLISYLGEITKEINGKKYGLVFEEHREKIDEILEENVPYLEDQDDLFVENGGETNFLIEGDNLAALQLLEKTHKGKIDVIYIDPPYNTGNKDFVYDDDFVEPTDMFRHSKWLCFMEKRLELAKDLLTEKGVIFISIDDNEQASLKFLCDKIFGNKNFICSMIRKTKSMTGDDGNGLNIQYEYLLLYAKMKVNVLLSGECKDFENFSNPDNDPNGIWCSADPSAKSGGEATYFSIKNPFTGKEDFPPKGRYWAFSKTTLEEYIKNGRIKFKKEYKKNQRGFIFKRYAEKMDNKFQPVSTLTFADNSYMNSVATVEINNIIGSGKFIYPKPSDFIKKIIKYSSTSSSTILDFFAGSGTTGHAVLKLNAEDGGHRKFILCTNNENNICREITYERLKTVITGNRKDSSKYSDGLAGSLKYLKINYLPIKEKMYYEYADELLEHIRALVELENAVNLDSEKSVAIVLDDEEFDKFVDSLDENSTCKKLYMGHDVLASAAQERKLKVNGISVNIVPEYYYPDLDF